VVLIKSTLVTNNTITKVAEKKLAGFKFILKH